MVAGGQPWALKPRLQTKQNVTIGNRLQKAAFWGNLLFVCAIYQSILLQNGIVFYYLPAVLQLYTCRVISGSAIRYGMFYN
jgi:hypothetical protein